MFVHGQKASAFLENYRVAIRNGATKDLRVKILVGVLWFLCAF